MRAVFYPLILLLALWLLHVLNFITGYTLNGLGILPRRLDTLWHIPLAPFLHASWQHLLCNSIPLAALGYLVMAHHPRLLWRVTFWVTVLAGLLVWLFAREGRHLGASMLVFGYFGFVLAQAWYQRSGKTLVIALLALFLYGGLFWGVLPASGRVSWEGHLAGLLAGWWCSRSLARQGNRPRFSR